MIDADMNRRLMMSASKWSYDRCCAIPVGWRNIYLSGTIHEAAQGPIDKQRNIQERSAATDNDKAKRSTRGAAAGLFGA